MQIEVVDDASDADDPALVVEEIGAGRVGFHRRPVNGGHIANFRTCLDRSRGRYVHLLHGDDAVCDGFYRAIRQGFEACPDAGAAFCRQIFIDEAGREIWRSPPERETSGPLENWLERIAVRQLIQTPSIVVRRDVYETLGTFDHRLSWVEDWEMWVRIAVHYPVWYESEPLALYRMHSCSSTSRKMRTGENLRDVQRAIAIIARQLPRNLAERLGRQSREFWAEDALVNRVPTFVRAGDLQAAVCQLREVLKLSHSCRTLSSVARLLPEITRLLFAPVLRKTS